MSTRFAVVSLWAEDVPACAHFYRDVLQLNLLNQHAHIPHFELHGIYLTILKGHPMAALEAIPARFPLIALAVDDLDQSLERLRAHGVQMPWGVEQDAGSRWVMFHDPAGNLIELVQF